MRKILLMLLMFVSFSEINAQVYYYRTTAFAYKTLNDYGNWTAWSDWEASDMVMTINFNSDVVKIYSPQTQTYRITQHVRNFTDNSGGAQMEFKFIDQDGDRGTMRLRVEASGQAQCYISFRDIMWVYNITRTN